MRMLRFALINLGARYRRGAVEYALNVNNLTDTEYFASVLYDTQLYPGEPINVLGTVASGFGNRGADSQGRSFWGGLVGSVLLDRPRRAGRFGSGS
jgi:outer membrane receptor protein involved in Fe transport